MPKGKFMPFKALHEGWTYVSLDDGRILGVKLVMTKIMTMEGPDGKPAVQPDGNPTYMVQAQNVVVVLSKEEWQVIKQKELGGQE